MVSEQRDLPQVGHGHVHDRVESQSIIDVEHIHDADTRGGTMRTRRNPSGQEERKRDKAKEKWTRKKA